MSDPRNAERIKTWTDAGGAGSSAFSPSRQYLNTLGEGSRRTMHQCLTSIATFMVGKKVDDPHTFRWELLTQEDVNRIVDHLTQSRRQDDPDKLRYHPATATKMLAALRGTMRAAERHARDNKLSPPATIKWTTIGLRPPVNVDQGAPPPLITSDVVKRLFKGCTKVAGPGGPGGPGGVRDAALLALYLSTGLRRAEVLALKLSDYNHADGTLHIHGEGPEKDRTVILRGGARAAFGDWLKARGDEPGPLFLPVGRGGIVRHRLMTSQAVYDIVGRIGRRAGVEPLTTRDIRRAYVVSLIRSGKTPEKVKALTGHASWINAEVCEQLARDRAGEGYDVDHLPYPPEAPGPGSPPRKSAPANAPGDRHTNPHGSKP